MRRFLFALGRTLFLLTDSLLIDLGILNAEDR